MHKERLAQSFSQNLLKDLLFLPMELKPPPLISEEKLEQLKSISFIRDNYRNCYHIPIFNADGSTQDFDKCTENNLAWSKAAFEVPELIEYIRMNFDWMVPMGRVVIICTPPKTQNPIHMDCGPDDITKLHIKFRSVLHGKTNTLWFLDSQQKHYVDEIGNRPFIMSGKFPHGMDNDGEHFKYTLAIGYPWENLLNQPFEDLLFKSFKKHNKNYISINQIQKPNNIEQYLSNELLR